jgi:hypothetical protein
MEMEERKPGALNYNKRSKNTLGTIQNHYRQEKQMETLSPHLKGRSWNYFSTTSF